ncbi:hypothetical protein [Rhizobium paknamense]|uniref:Uncharacterized protein n=1 Tax=Rhizobium paknamense TaxID=1206817 RepID=A0ABU0IFN1_9HYPH|nr:hypothetical protein [Rhizobium paknamense]MDQ0456024.1 hypothetical protein [Rhizobium paknamense]
MHELHFKNSFAELEARLDALAFPSEWRESLRVVTSKGVYMLTVEPVSLHNHHIRLGMPELETRPSEDGFVVVLPESFLGKRCA